MKVDDVADHVMDSERYEISADAASRLNRALDERRTIVAVGTTSVRTLESAIRAGDGRFNAGSAETNIFITPGFQFRAVDRLLTNFHLPESTLLMLVSAFAGIGTIRRAYSEAIAHRYFFYSYGDCMFLEERSDETHPLLPPRLVDRHLRRSGADAAAHSSDRKKSRAEEAGKGRAGAAARVAGAAETGFAEEGCAASGELRQPSPNPIGAEGAAEKKEDKKWDVNNPPGPQYDVPIDVTEGTWLSLDVSPDGNEIAFDLLGDIYTMPIDAAARRRRSPPASPGTCSRATRRTASGSPSPATAPAATTSGS